MGDSVVIKRLPVVKKRDDFFIDGRRVSPGDYRRRVSSWGKLRTRYKCVYNDREVACKKLCAKFWKLRREGIRIGIPSFCFGGVKKKTSDHPTRNALNNLEAQRAKIRNNYTPRVIPEPKSVVNSSAAKRKEGFWGFVGDHLAEILLVGANALIWGAVLYFLLKGRKDDDPDDDLKLNEPKDLPPEAQALRITATTLQEFKIAGGGIRLVEPRLNISIDLRDSFIASSLEGDERALMLVHYWMQNKIKEKNGDVEASARMFQQLAMNCAGDTRSLDEMMMHQGNELEELLRCSAYQIEHGVGGMFFLEGISANLGNFWRKRALGAVDSERKKLSANMQRDMSHALRAIAVGDFSVVVDKLERSASRAEDVDKTAAALHKLVLAELHYRIASCVTDDTLRMMHLRHAEKNSVGVLDALNEKTLSDHAFRIETLSTNALRAQGGGIRLSPVGKIVPGYGATAIIRPLAGVSGR